MRVYWFGCTTLISVGVGRMRVGPREEISSGCDGTCVCVRARAYVRAYVEGTGRLEGEKYLRSAG